MSTKKFKPPAIPSVPSTDSETYSFLRALKENIELLTGTRNSNSTSVIGSLTSSTTTTTGGGSTTVTLNLSTPATVLAAGADGTVISYSSAYGQATVREDNADVTTASTLSVVNQTNCTGTINTAADTPVSGKPKGYYTVTSLTQDTGSITFRAVYNSITVDATYSLAKARAGSASSTAALVLTRTAIVVPSYANGVPIDLTNAFGYAKMYLGSTDVTADATLSLTATGCTATLNTADNTPVNGQIKGYYVVTAVPSESGSLTVTAVYGGETYTQTVSVTRAQYGYEIVNTLPNTNLFAGRLVYLTTDGKLYRYNGTAWTAAVATNDLIGQIVSSQVADSAITTAKFATTIRPIELVSVLPAPGQQGRVVFNTSDNKLYRDTGTAWTTQVLTSDLLGTISASQIADGAVTTNKFASSIEPVTVVTGALPTVKITSTIFRTDDQKLYRWSGTAYVATVPTTDLTGLIVANQIQDGILTTAKFASTIEPVTIVSGALPTTKITNTIYRTDDQKLYRWSGTAYVASVPTTDLVGTISTAQIADGSISYAKFASTIEPITVVTGTLPVAKLTSTIFRTDDQKLYRWSGTAYVATVPATDLTGQITTAQIADAALTTAKFASTIEPVTVVSSVPTVKSTNTIYNSTDRKIYRWNGTAYVATVATTDLTGTVTDAQIAGLAASKVTGQLTDSQLASISAAKLTGQITTTQITDNSISTAKLAAGAVTAAQIAADTITAAQIAASAITSSELAAGAVVAGKIAAGTIQAADIAAGTITGDRIAASTITGSNIAADTITAGQIAAGAVSTSELAAGAVNASKIAAGTITSNEIAANTITGTNIAAGTITAANIATDTITAGQIAAGAINTSELAAGAVNASKIAAGSITGNEIAANTITGGKIAANTITGSNIAAGTITASNIATDTITAGQIAAGAIGASEIAAGAVIADKLAVGLGGNNLVKNSSFENGWAGFGQYDNSAQSNTAFISGGGRNGGYCYRISYSVNNSTKGFYLTYNSGFDGQYTENRNIFKSGRWYVFSWYAKATGAAVGATMFTAWNNSPSQIITRANPPLTGDWQRYAFALYWNAGTTVDNAGYASVNGGSGVATIDFDDVQVEEGEYPTAYRLPLLDGEIRGTYIADGAITTNKITAGTITGDKIAAGTITAANIATDTITAGQIAAGAINTSELAAGAVTANILAASAVIAGKVAAGAISTSELAAGAVNASKIAAGTITSNEIAANTITAGNIASGTITTNQLAAGSVTTNNISAGAITSAKMNTTEFATVGLSAITGNIGTITSGYIQNAASSPSFLMNLNWPYLWMKGASYMRVSGLGIGSSGQFVDWYGANQAALTSCTETNALYYLKSDGSAMFAGRIRGEFEPKAWVVFNGVNGVTIYDRFNVSSVSRTNAGIYTINFATTLPNANYVMTGTADYSSGTLRYIVPQTRTTTTCSFQTRGSNNAGDSDYVGVIIFGSNVVNSSNVATPTGGYGGGTYGGGYLP